MAPTFGVFCVGQGRSGHPEMAYMRSAEFRLQKDLNANRDAARARRAAHIEACRQAEIARYGFTTINGDVTEMVA
jgi:hypothetical protein